MGAAVGVKTKLAGAALLAGRYRFDGLLGSGSFGRVVRVRDEAANGARRAIKGVPASGGERLVWEGETLFGLAHPRLVRVHEVLRLDADAPAPFGFRAGSILLVEGFVDGRSADRALSDLDGDARVARALEVADDVLAALSELHARGLAHGDVKSGNVLVGADGRATLIDLGLCRPFGRSPMAVGTPRAMAPESWLGVSSPTTDVYALGVMLLELLGASPRRTADSASEPLRPGYVPAPPIEALGAAVPDAVRRALGELVDASVDRRVATAREARTRLRMLPGRSLTAAEAVDAGAPGTDERAASVARLPWQGPIRPVTELAEALEREPIVVVAGAPGSGRTRLVEEAVLRFQLARAASARTALTLVQASGELLVDEPTHPTLVHVEGATEATVEAARRLVRSAGIGGVELRLVLEGTELAAMGAPVVTPAPLGVAEVERLIGAAVATPVPREVAAEMHARSGGRAGSLCRAIAAGLRASVDFARKDAVALLPWGDALTEAPSADARGALWRVAVAGGVLPASAVPPAAARELVAAGIAYVTLDGRVAIEPSLAARARLTVSDDARAEIVRELAGADLDPVARAYVRITGGEVEEGVADLAAWSRAALARGEPGRVVERVAPLLEGGVRGSLPSLRLLVAEAERRLGRYDRAEARLVGLDADVAAQSRAAELARLRGDVPRARETAERAVATGGAAEAALVLARLDLDRGGLEEAMSRVEAVAPACEASPELRARCAELRALAAMARGSLREAERIAARAFDDALRADAAGPAARLATVVGAAILAQGRPALALHAFERGVELADGAGELHLGATARLNLGLVRLDLGVIGPGRESLEGSARTLARLGRDADVARALYNLAHAALLTADVESGRRFAGLSRAAADRAGDVTVSALLSLVEGDVALREGRFGEATQVLLRAAERASALAPTMAAQLLARASPLVLAAGRADDAERILAEAERHGEAAAVDVAIARVRLALHRNDLEGAARDGRELARVLAEAEAPWEQRVRASLAVIDAHDAAGHRDLAQAERSECRRLLDQAFRHLDVGARRRLRQLPSFAKVLESAPSVAPPDDPARWRALATDAAWLLGEHRSSRLAEQVLRLALSTSGAERAYLVQREPDGAIRVVAGSSARGPLAPGERDQLSRSICRRGFETGRPMATSHADVDERLRASESVQTLALRSVAFVPMPIDDGSLLGLYVEDRQRPSAFGDEDLALLSTLGRLSARAIAAATQRRKERRAARRLAIEQRSLRRELDRRSAELEALRAHAEGPGAFHGVIAKSPAMLEVMRLARRVARAAVPVLVHGESGTGKELIARAIHAESPRAGRPFIAENCGAIPETLLESALFGHVKGAFTGADRDRAGLFEVADGGTLFLDEIGEMSPSMQVRLLRVLEDGQVRPVGSTKVRRVDVRIVAASHRDLAELVERGAFRQDLFFRLAVVRVDIPPLRDRVDDVPLLVAHFLEKHGSEDARFSRAAMDRMLAHPFPGNVRELENEVRRAIALSDGEIRPEHLSPAVRTRPRPDGGGGTRLRDQVDALERRLIEEALERHGGNQSRAAEALGVSRYGLQKMLSRLGLR